MLCRRCIVRPCLQSCLTERTSVIVCRADPEQTHAHAHLSEVWQHQPSQQGHFPECARTHRGHCATATFFFLICRGQASRSQELILVIRRWAKDRGVCHAPKARCQGISGFYTERQLSRKKQQVSNVSQGLYIMYCNGAKQQSNGIFS